MSEFSQAPWTNEEVANLNGYQECAFHHPFTCGECGSDLRATHEGWMCPAEGCDYVQDWAHCFMANGSWKVTAEHIRSTQL